VVPLHEKTDITSLRYITGEVARAPSEELAAAAAQLHSGLNRDGRSHGEPCVDEQDAAL
jgi:hypothetical protein